MNTLLNENVITYIETIFGPLKTKDRHFANFVVIDSTVSCRSATQSQSQRTHDAIIKSLWRQNDVATSFWRHIDVIIASYDRRECGVRAVKGECERGFGKCFFLSQPSRSTMLTIFLPTTSSRRASRWNATTSSTPLSGRPSVLTKALTSGSCASMMPYQASGMHAGTTWSLRWASQRDWASRQRWKKPEGNWARLV